MKKLLLLVVYAIPAFAAPVAPLVQPRVNLAQIKLPIEFGQIITANGAHCPSMLACPFGVSSGPIWANWHVDGSGNLLVASGGSPVSSGTLTCPSAGACPLGLTPGGAWSFLNVDGSGNLLVACSGCGSAVQVAGTGLTAGDTLNFNATTPVAGANGVNVTFQTSKSSTTDSISAEVVGDGTSTHYLSGTGVYSTPSGLPAGLTFSLPTLTISSAGNGNGALALSGTTSGVATCTAPAVAGTSTNPVTCTNALSLGTNPATSGMFNLPNAGKIVARNAANSADFNVIQSDASNGIDIGQGGAAPAYVDIFAGAATGGQVSVNIGNNAHEVATDSGSAWCVSSDTCHWRLAAGLFSEGSSTAASVTGFVKNGMTAAITTADVTCGTGGTISSCTTATTITGLTFTLPLFATNWAMDCDLVVGQATAATANQWLIQTATNGVTNTTASYTMATAATAMAVGAVTDQASTTTAFQIAPSWTLGGTATKMPVHIHAMFEGVSVSGTVINLQVIAPTVGDLLTIYRGASCSLHP